VNQRTIQKPVDLSGVGLFTGVETNLRILPAMVNTGIVFVRTDLASRPRIKADIEHAPEPQRRTAIEQDGAQVETVEHLLSALSGLGIDNVEIEIDNIEVPILDGSAEPFVTALRDAEIVEQEASRNPIRIETPISVTDGDTSLVALPNPDGGLSVSYTLDYSQSSLIGSQHFTYNGSEEHFVESIAPARTFCLEEEIEQFKAMGLGKGATHQNTLVVGADGVIDNELHWPDEFVDRCRPTSWPSRADMDSTTSWPARFSPTRVSGSARTTARPGWMFERSSRFCRTATRSCS
jgi:UDP-3-O-acyl N-acetylglucosamine deacetylase